MASWPTGRPEDYNPDKSWDEETGVWITSDSRGGGKYKQQLVVINDRGDVYFSEV